MLLSRKYPFLLLWKYSVGGRLQPADINYPVRFVTNFNEKALRRCDTRQQPKDIGRIRAGVIGGKKKTRKRKADGS